MSKWASNYLTIPFKDNGRDHSGCDCWGLVRLVLAEQFEMSFLPSYADTYASTLDLQAMAKVIDLVQDEWEEIERNKIQAGDVVLMRQRGLPIHLGIIVDPKNVLTLHTSPQTGPVLERMESMLWSRRVLGVYRYKKVQILAPSVDSGIRFIGRPDFTSPRVDVMLPEGLTILEMMDGMKISSIVKEHGSVFLGDMLIPREQWHVIRPKTGTQISFALTPSGGGGGSSNDSNKTLRTFLTAIVIVVAIVAPYAIPELAGTLGGALLTAGITVGGILAINALVPVRTPSLDSESDIEKTGAFLTGSQNRLTPFGIVPQILGRIRTTPPHAAQPFALPFGDDVFLYLLLLWGKGPMTIPDQLKIGETLASNFEEVDIQHISGFKEDPTVFLPTDIYDNLVTKSEELEHADWNRVGLSDVVSNALTGPTGQLSAEKLEENGSTSEHRIDQAVSFTTGLQYIVEVSAKKGERDEFWLELPGGPFPGNPRAVFNLTTGVIDSQAEVDSASIVAEEDGWYRCAIVATADVTTVGLVQLQIALTGAQSYLGVSGNGLYLDHVNVRQTNSTGPYVSTRNDPASAIFIPEHNFIPGTVLRFESTGTLPTELLADPDITFVPTDVDITDNQIIFSSPHGLVEGQPVQFAIQEGDLPNGLNTGSIFFANVVDTDTLKFKTTNNAKSINVNLNSIGAGTLVMKRGYFVSEADVDYFRISKSIGDSDILISNKGTGAHTVSRMLVRNSIYVNDTNTLTLSVATTEDFHVETTPENIDEFHVEFTAPGGLSKFNDDGDRKNLAVEFEIQYAPSPGTPITLPFTAVDTGADLFNYVGHPFADDDIVDFTTSGSLPSPITSGTDYYVVNATADTFKVSTTKGGSAENLTNQGTGNHTITSHDWSDQLTKDFVARELDIPSSPKRNRVEANQSGGYIIYGTTRYDNVWIDKRTGIVGISKGPTANTSKEGGQEGRGEDGGPIFPRYSEPRDPPFSNSNWLTSALAGTILNGVGSDTPIFEGVTNTIPKHAVRLCRIVQKSESPGITAEDIVDLRKSTNPFTNPPPGGDFLCTIHPTLPNEIIQVAGGTLEREVFRIEAATPNILRRHEVIFPIQGRGTYDVRVRRTSPDSTDPQRVDDVRWTAVRGITYRPPVNEDGLSMTAMKIKSTNQLEGALPGINGVVQTICPDWDGTIGKWVFRATSNPASLYRYVLRGADGANARPLPLSRINDTVLQDWHTECVAQGWTYNRTHDFAARDVYEVLLDITAAGRASPALIDGTWGVVIDREQPAPVQHFTPFNSFGFTGSKSFFKDKPHAIRARFVDQDRGWKQSERIVYADGFSEANTTRFETMEFPGVTDEQSVWRHARFKMAETELRLESVDIRVNLEGIVCSRGDYILFTHDVMKVGLGSGRIARVFQRLTGTPTTAQAGPGATTLIDTVNDFTTFNALPGDVILNVTDGSSAQVVSIDSADQITHTVLTGGTNNDWELTDTYEVHASNGDIKEVILEQAVPMEAGKSYSLSVRTLTDIETLLPVDTQAGEQTNLVLTSSTPAAVAPAAGDLFGFGETAVGPTLLLLVKGIEPEAGMIFNIACVNAGSPDIFRADIEDLSFQPVSVDVGTDTFNIVNHKVVDGDIVSFSSDSSLPGGLPTNPSTFNTVDVNDVTDVLTVTSHGVVDNQRVAIIAPEKIPDGLVNGRKYFAVNTTVDTLQLALERSGDPIDITDQGIGTFFLTPIFIVTNVSGDTFQVKAVDEGSPINLTSQGTGTHTLHRLIPVYNPQITETPEFVLPAPLIEDTRSDASVLIREANGTLTSRILVSLVEPVGLTDDISLVKTNIRRLTETKWNKGPLISGWDKHISFSPVEDKQDYEFRIQYINGKGEEGPWSTTISHTIIGKSGTPADVTNFVGSFSGDRATLTWDKVPDRDVNEYEIRRGNSGWDLGVFVARVSGTSHELGPISVGDETFMIKAVDTYNPPLFSNTEATYVFTIDLPSTPVFTPAPVFQGANLNLKWQSTPGTYSIRSYEIRRGGTTFENATFERFTDASSYITDADWSGTEKWWVQAIDAVGNTSTAGSVDITVNLPIVSNFRETVIDNNVRLNWDSTPGSLPIETYEILRGDVLGTADIVASVDATTAYINEIFDGTYTYWVRPVDTAGNTGIAISLQTTVDAPPDFVFRKSRESEFTGITRTDVRRDYSGLRSGLVMDGTINAGCHLDDHTDINTRVLGYNDKTVEVTFETSDDVTTRQVVYEQGGASAGMTIYIGNGNLYVGIYSSSGASTQFLNTPIEANTLNYAALTFHFDGFSSGTLRGYHSSTHIGRKIPTPTEFANGAFNEKLTAHADEAGIGRINNNTRQHDGAKVVANGDNFNGTIIDLRLWNEERSVANLQAKYDLDLDGNETNLIWYSRFDTGEGLSVNDLSTNDHQAQISGSGSLWRAGSSFLVAPVDTSQTVDQYHTAQEGRSDLSPQDNIDAGYNHWLQPSDITTGVYEEILDVGAVVSSSRIIVRVQSTILGGTPTITPLISVRKLATDSWTDLTSGQFDQFAQDFQYVRVRLTINASGLSDLIHITSMTTTLRSKLISDQGNVVVTTQGQTINFNNSYKKILAVEGVARSTSGDIIFNAELDPDALSPLSFDVYLKDRSTGNFPVGGATVFWTARGFS
jgi:hypothetical protein